MIDGTQLDELAGHFNGFDGDSAQTMLIALGMSPTYAGVVNHLLGRLDDLYSEASFSPEEGLDDEWDDVFGQLEELIKSFLGKEEGQRLLDASNLDFPIEQFEEGLREREEEDEDW